MQDVSGLIPAGKVTGLTPTGQGTDEVSDLSHAMTAPGSVPALAVEPPRNDPPAPVIDAPLSEEHIFTGYVGDQEGGSATGTWDKPRLNIGGWTNIP